MNDPSAQPIDIEEQRVWLAEHKASTGLSWKQLANRIGMKHSTLSLWVGNNYNAPGDKIAEAVFRYRQTLTQQAALKGETPTIPSYFDSETSQQLIYLLGWAQRGRIVAGALSPGLGKTITAEHYKACNANVFMVTATPATATLTSMMGSVMKALGKTGPSLSTYYFSAGLSLQIEDRVRDLANPLLIVDEAQHLHDKSIEQIRSWHDSTGLGVALLGNAGLLQTLEGGTRSVAKAQLFSRISLKLERVRPLTADVDAMLEAWKLTDDAICEFVHSVAQKPGGLRGATFALELGHMVAQAAHEELNVSHVQDAWTQLSSRAVAA